MARFLVVVVPLVARVWPAVAIGEALAEAGHEVAWCGPESALRPLLHPDATIFPTGKRSYRQTAQMGSAAVRELWDEYVLPLNRFIARTVDQAMARYRPDVVLADQYALAGALAAEKLDIRWATLAAGVLELTPPIEDPGLQDWVRSKVRQVMTASGLPDDKGVDPLFSPHLVIATTAQALIGTTVPAHWALIGAALGTRRGDPDFRWDWWDSDQRHVLVTAGTLSAHLVEGFLARVLAALGPMAGRVQVVVNAAPEAVPGPPANVLVAARIPMLKLMPRLDAVICQAGQSTVNGALIHGVPLVVAPIRLGELATAGQVTRTGAGIAVSMANSTVTEIAAAVTAVLDEPGYRAQARRMAQEFASAGGTKVAAERLAALAARPAAPEPPRGGI
ncbi:MAG TPA: nucleotide disphospho-sugar-binding domain-containing protein [Streptosporangiaceae bacterium]|nr:nucleotide disphospho-sugar-binding domain-containing protein [Streptosporangiaceae bacterium]